jgi:hypothetical protein
MNNRPTILTDNDLDAVRGGGKAGAVHRDRIRDAILDLLRKMSEIKGLS